MVSEETIQFVIDKSAVQAVRLVIAELRALRKVADAAERAIAWSGTEAELVAALRDAGRLP